MPEADIDVTKLPSSFYRVTSRAIVLDGQNRLLTMINRDGNHEIPGGGWEHDETFEQSLQRELQEELGVQAKFIGQISGAWLNEHKWWGFKVLRLAAPVELASFDFVPTDTMQSVEWVDKKRFMEIDWKYDADDKQAVADLIWGENVRS